MLKNRFYEKFDEERPDEKKSVDQVRTNFQRDRDGVIYSSAFRRLQTKTQVLMAGTYDFYRTRLTHSIEVAQIGRSICHYLKETSDELSNDFYIDPDLVEGICLAHDLGHPPFGHAGERTLHECMRHEFGGFEGNAQSLRLITETIYSSGFKRKGLNPSRAFLDGILKYKVPFHLVSDAPNHFIYENQVPWLNFVFPDGILQKYVPLEKQNKFHSIECQIMDWADDTAYSINDIVDSVHAGLIRSDQIHLWMKTYPFSEKEKTLLKNLIETIESGYISSWAGQKIGIFIQAVKLKKRDSPLSEFTNRYRFDLEVGENLLQEAALYKRLSMELVFQSTRLQQLEFKNKQALTRLFNTISEHYLHSPKKEILALLSPAYHKQIIDNEDVTIKMRILCDYLAGMTDGFAIRMYNRLFQMETNSLDHLII